MLKRTILVDLDGVLNDYKGDYEKNLIPDPKKNVEMFLEYLHQDFEIVIFTTRNLLQTAKWLIKNNLDGFVQDISNIKKPAYLCIDDRAIQFNGDFNTTIEQIKNYQPYWKQL